MLDEFLTETEIAAVRAPIERAHTLPPRCYTDPDFYAFEVDRVLRRSWLPAGRVDQVAEPGDYFTLDLLSEPLLIVRDRDGVIRALSNVCAHRWMPVASGAGNARSFQCPYHYWTYGLDGRLVGSPEMERAEGFDRRGCRLPELRSEVWQGFVFVNFDPDAEPLAPRLESLRPHVEPYRLERQVSTPRIDYDCAWNWKITIENGSESYHHMGLHRSILEELLPAARSDIQPGRKDFSLYWNPTREGQEFPAALPIPPDLSRRQRTSLQLVTIFPCTLFFMAPDHTAWLHVVPNDAEHHTAHYVPLVQPEALDDPEVDVKLDVVRKTLDAVHQQDLRACIDVRRGLRSTLARPGRFSHLEETIWQFQNWLIDRLDAAA